MQWARLPIYPLLLGTFPVAAYFTQNRLELDWPELARPLTVSLAGTAAVLGLFHLLTPKRDLAMLLTALFLLWAYIYSFVFHQVAFWVRQVSDRQVLIPWCVVGAVVLIVVGVRLRRSERLAALTGFMNLFAGVLWLVVLIAGVTSEGRTMRAASLDVQRMEARPDTGWATPDNLASARERQHPDIYWVILDGYARGDILQSRFGYDNSEFLDQLRNCGFYVADRAHANYAWTHLSLSATLNGQYLQDLLPDDFGAQAPQDRKDRYMYFLNTLSASEIQSNRTRQFLEKLGYQWLTTKSGYAVTRPQGTPFSEVAFGIMTQFERLLLRKTVFEPIVNETPLPGEWKLSTKSDFIQFELQKLARLPELSGPFFAFYHILAPHTPFCFDEQGNAIASSPVFGSSGWQEDLRAMPGYDQYYRQNYPKNVAGLNIHAWQAIRTLREQTEGKAIIIVQSDHGSCMGLTASDISKSDVPERFGILNAIYLPEQYSRGELDPAISSVNTFRVVLSTVFGADLPKLPDRAWYSYGDLDFTEVTSLVVGPDSSPSLQRESDRQP